MKIVIFKLLIVGFVVSCQNNSQTVEQDTHSTDSVQFSQDQAPSTVDSITDTNVILFNTSLESYYLRFAFNDSLRIDHDGAIDFLDENDIDYEETYHNDLQEEVIIFLLEDLDWDDVEFRFHYLDDEDGDYCRYSHNFNYDNSAKANSFREFAFNDLVERFGREYAENNSLNCSNYYWQYNANLLYNCKTSPNSVSICSP